MIMRNNERYLTIEELKSWRQIDKAKNIVITSHIHPDGDAIGSSLAMLRYCRALGKHASVVIDDDIPDMYKFLPDFVEIRRPVDVQRSADTDLLIIMDTSPKRIGMINEWQFGGVLNIDHHGTNPELADYHIIRNDLSSASELLYNIFIDVGYKVDAETASCLYAGLITDTVFFKAPNLTAKSFEMAARLVDLGVDSGHIASCLETKDLGEVRLGSRALSELKNFYDGRVVGVTLDDRYDELKLTDFVIDTIRYIKGVQIAFLLKKEDEGGYRVRMRSQSVDVSEFAKMNGGGGHIDAAGFTVSIDDGVEAEHEFIRRIGKWLEQYSG